ncbi:hypothetical protein HIM_03484 [Hirsutella minnesotensis 3608]|uniref:Uncharacterized protein n=1 Tax=Hirsutella minnesotensis 3608 TaxID=1043627 RepID=A0A0F7ZVT3_9HYPO|nr:hypothetical protein HIM_03484 [Hirsutella minnesotensis 3608]
MSSSAAQQGTLASDTIESLSDPLACTSSIDSLVSLLAIAFRAKVHRTCQGERLSNLMHTMSLPLPAKRDGGAYLSSFIHFLSPVLNGLAGMQDFATAVEGLSQPEDFRKFGASKGAT